MTEANDSQCCDQRKRNIYQVTSSININTKIKQQQTCIFHPTMQNSFITTVNLVSSSTKHFLSLFLPREIIFGLLLQFQEESDEESTRADLELPRATCSSRLRITQSKLPIKIPTLLWKFAKFRRKEHPV